MGSNPLFFYVNRPLKLPHQVMGNGAAKLLGRAGLENKAHYWNNKKINLTGHGKNKTRPRKMTLC